jgi:hypothetical protein
MDTKTNMTAELMFPTEVIDLPSRGLLYPTSSLLSQGTVEMKYMTAKEEDILTNRNYIEKGVVVDKLLQSLILSKVNYNELLLGDHNAIMIAARILGYGKDYEFTYKGETQVVDLTLLEDKTLDTSLFTPNVNEFHFQLPTTKANITFKLLTIGDEDKIRQELNGLKKVQKDSNPAISTRLKHMITSIEGVRDTKAIREFVDTRLLAKDSRALREYSNKIQPDLDLTVTVTVGDVEEDIRLPITVDFFWPNT